MIATASPAANPVSIARPIRRGGMPAAMSAAETAIVTRTRTPCSSPQPIDPKINSPRNSGRPIARSSPAKIAAPTASPPSAATRLISLVISSSSAFASSTWASTRRRPAAIVAAIWARSPGGGGGGGGVEPGVRPLGGGGGGGGVADPPIPWAPARVPRVPWTRTRGLRPVVRPPIRQAARPAADRPDPGSAVRATATRPVGWAPRVCASGRPGDDTSGRRRDRHAPEAAACCSDVAVGRTVRPLPAARGRPAGRRRRRTRRRGGTRSRQDRAARPAAVRQRYRSSSSSRPASSAGPRGPGMSA